MEHSNEVVEDLIDHCLVEDAFLAKPEEIVLEGLELDAQAVRHIFDSDDTKVR